MSNHQQSDQSLSSLPKLVSNEGSNYKQIQTLLHLNSVKRIKIQSKSMQDIKLQQVQIQKEQNKAKNSNQNNIQIQKMIKTVLQDHLNFIKINNLKYYCVTKMGMRNFETLQNQDVILIDKLALNFKVFAIFDGFGQFGKQIAEIASKTFKSYLKSFQQQFKRNISKNQVQKIVKQCIKKTQNYLINYKFNQVNYSGTTALIVLVSSVQIFTFNIGNSRAIIGINKNDKICEFQITHDQDLSRLDQRLRIMSCGAQISQLKDYLGEGYGPERLWNKDEKRPGTYITRALGLLCGQKSGILSQCEVNVINYKSNMKFVVLASDGLWSVQENDEVVQCLEHYHTQKHMQMGITSLLQQSVKRWKTKSQLMDDISIIVVSLN